MSRPRIVIVGGGLGGLAAAKKLAKRELDLTLIDRANHHLFQPLLYQVATGGLSPANIATPLRSLFRGRDTVQVLQGEVQNVDFVGRTVQTAMSSFRYDYLLLAAGGRTSYFGNPQEHAAANLLRLMRGCTTKPFRYRDYGNMAVIGRGAAVADLRGLHLSGYPAWLAWLFVHLLQLVGYQNRSLVAMQWGWNYLTRNCSARLIVSADAIK